MFSYTIDGLGNVPARSINVAEAFDPELLKEGPEDFCRLEAAPDTVTRGIQAQTESAPSLWRPLSWVRASKIDTAKVTRKLRIEQGDEVKEAASESKSTPSGGISTTKPQDDPDINTLSKMLLARQVKIQAHCASLGLMTKSSHDPHTNAQDDDIFDFDDEDFGDFPELTPYHQIPSLVPPPRSSSSQSDMQHSNDAHSSSLVQFCTPEKPRAISPRPMADYTFVQEDPSTWTDASKPPSNETSDDNNASTFASEMSSDSDNQGHSGSISANSLHGQEPGSHVTLVPLGMNVYEAWLRAFEDLEVESDTSDSDVDTDLEEEDATEIGSDDEDEDEIFFDARE
jgi:hypothetical protein